MIYINITESVYTGCALLLKKFVKEKDRFIFSGVVKYVHYSCVKNVEYILYDKFSKLFQVFILSDMHELIQTAPNDILNNVIQLTPHLNNLLMVKLHSGRDQRQINSLMQKSPPPCITNLLTSISTPLSKKRSRTTLPCKLIDSEMILCNPNRFCYSK